MRLIDIEPPVRIRAAEECIKREVDPLERLHIMLLAYFPPPELTAWVRP